MAWLEILPGYTTLFRRHGRDSASSFLASTGILVNKHRHRQVEQVTLGSEHFYLKKEDAVSWHDRFRNAWAGFGWCSTAVREAATLQALRKAGIRCPEVVALGEDRRQAFVLTREAAGMTELRVLLPKLAEVERYRLANVLGQELTRIHDAGFDHPDLFAKHILAAADGAGFRLCILDWQRSRHRRSVPWRVRCRDLAALDATLHEALASDRLRLRCLRAYLKSAQIRVPLKIAAALVRGQAARLRESRSIREIGQPAVPAGDQEFVSLDEGRLLIVRSSYERLARFEPEAIAHGSPSALAAALGSEKIVRQSWPTTGPSREIPPLAHTLFRLQRFGVPAPRLLAMGYAEEHNYLVTESVATIPFEEAFAKASFALRARLLQRAGAMVRQLHEAGYHLPAWETWPCRLGVVPSTGALFLAKVEPLPRDNVPWQERAPREFNRQKIRLSRTDQLRFLHGYLRRSGDRKPMSKSTNEARERQAVS